MDDTRRMDEAMPYPQDSDWSQTQTNPSADRFPERDTRCDTRWGQDYIAQCTEKSSQELPVV